MRVALRPGGGASRQRVQRAGLGPHCGPGPQGGCGSGRRRGTWGLESGRVRCACVACLYSWRGPLGFDVHAPWTDDGIAVRFADPDAPPDPDLLVPDPDRIADRVLDQLGHSSLFASRFRENAARALLLPQRRIRGRSPLWMQRLRAANLLGKVRADPAFPVVVKPYRECLEDVLDVSALTEVLQAVRSGEIEVREVTREAPSPFARSLAVAYVAAYLNKATPRPLSGAHVRDRGGAPRGRVQARRGPDGDPGHVSRGDAGTGESAEAGEGRGASRLPHQAQRTGHHPPGVLRRWRPRRRVSRRRACTWRRRRPSCHQPPCPGTPGRLRPRPSASSRCPSACPETPDRRSPDPRRPSSRGPAACPACPRPCGPCRTSPRPCTSPPASPPRASRSCPTTCRPSRRPWRPSPAASDRGRRPSRRPATPRGPPSPRPTRAARPPATLRTGRSRPCRPSRPCRRRSPATRALRPPRPPSPA
ncbi:MAG: hypothetical protein FJ087_10020 [Deltaproteobacteria bacterium]|nr:hypothetical protein [Deltaproteobacteria bacterium]